MVEPDTSDMERYPEKRQEVVQAVDLLFRAGMISPSGHANLSARLEDDQMLLTSNALVRDLVENDLAVVSFDGRVEEGRLEACTQEIVGMHSAVYRARGGVGAVIHTHSPGATAFALAARPLPCRYETLLRFGQIGDVPVVAWAPRGSDASVHGIVRALGDHTGTTAILLANHGLLTFAASPASAAMVVVAVEEASRAELSALGLGGAKDFPEDAVTDVMASMARATP